MADKAFNTNVNPRYNQDGFHMTFENGCTISVQFGKHTYSNQGETTAEIGAWHSNGNWMIHQEGGWIEIPDGSSDVMTHKTADEVAHLMLTLSQYK